MERLVKKVNDVLVKAFPPPSKVEFLESDRIVCTVRSGRFRGKDDMKRQKMLWTPLEKNLTREERRNIVILVGFTPEEELAHLSSIDGE